MRAPLRRWSAAALAVAVLGLFAAGPALAAPSGSATGADGQRLTAGQVSDLASGGQRITVTGTGYPTFKGIYVAVCKLPPAGERPTPCGGGVDTSGATETSKWISSNPPTYGKGLAVPFGTGGTFSVDLWAAPTLPDGQDCRQVACAVITRADHTRTSDRSQDVMVPVTFASADNGASALPVVFGIVGALLVVLIVAAVVVVTRRRRSLRTHHVDSDPTGPSDATAEASA